MSDTLSRSARGSVNHLPCVFAGVLDAREAVCGLAVHYEGEACCSQPLARAHCAQIDGLLRQALRFVVQTRSDPLAPNSKAHSLQIQARGLQALQQVLDPAAHAIDVQRLLMALEARPGGLADLSLPQLIQLAARN